eukprot:TRINITY_DN36366_c0_g1_i1.p1 TRINITY_DN36366_c0_g1~~TRINITY_DN36366_c0_g1_i1.p1  ORF type:complete len:469 (-),score=84.77 TRINITY_DN36366_c0_g1_i1:71-1417(-)
MKARRVQVWLCFGARLAFQGNRLIFSGLMPVVARDLGFDSITQGSLMSAYPLGYSLTPVLGGLAADRFGGRSVMQLAIVSAGLGSILAGCLGGFWTIWATTFIVGLLNGPSFSTNGVILSRWVPMCERAQSTAITDCGGPLGAAVALFGTPVVASVFGWRATLFLCGGVTMVLAALWQALAANDPGSCSYLTAEEEKELRSWGVISASGKKVVEAEEEATKRSALPLRVLTFPSVWAVVLAHCAFNFPRYLLYAWTVTFFTDALRVPVASAGMCMFWPNMADAVCSVLVGRLGDIMVTSGRLSTLATRRLSSTIGFAGTGVFALLLGQQTDTTSATVFLTMAAAVQSCHNAGFKSNYGDLTKEYSGMLAGLGNTFASVASFLSPVLGARTLEAFGGPNEASSWSALYSLIFFCCFGGILFYVPLASTESIDDKLRGWSTNGNNGKKDL